MRISVLLLGLLIVVALFSGVIGFGLDSIFKKGLVDIHENFQLSIAILFFVSCSLIQMLFYKNIGHEYIAGIIVGLGIASFLTGFTSSLGIAIILYAGSFNSLKNTYQEKYSNDS